MFEKSSIDIQVQDKNHRRAVTSTVRISTSTRLPVSPLPTLYTLLQGMTPLSIASSKGDDEGIEALIAAGSDVNVLHVSSHSSFRSSSSEDSVPSESSL
jgi:hypothetical protein